jgi:hypothetical protein
MRKPLLWFWGFWFLVGFCFEVWAVWGRPAPDDTLSEFTWYMVRGQTVAGFLFLTGLLVWLAWWFPKHIRELKGRKKVTLIVLEPGAPVQKGQPYIVGEKRPERFYPASPGTIVPPPEGPFGRIDREDY